MPFPRTLGFWGGAPGNLSRYKGRRLVRAQTAAGARKGKRHRFHGARERDGLQVHTQPRQQQHQGGRGAATSAATAGLRHSSRHAGSAQQRRSISGFMHLTLSLSRRRGPTRCRCTDASARTGLLSCAHNACQTAIEQRHFKPGSTWLEGGTLYCMLSSATDLLLQ